MAVACCGWMDGRMDWIEVGWGLGPDVVDGCMDMDAAFLPSSTWMEHSPTQG